MEDNIIKELENVGANRHLKKKKKYSINYRIALKQTSNCGGEPCYTSICDLVCSASRNGRRGVRSVSIRSRRRVTARCPMVFVVGSRNGRRRVAEARWRLDPGNGAWTVGNG